MDSIPDMSLVSVLAKTQRFYAAINHSTFMRYQNAYYTYIYLQNVYALR